MLIQNTDTIECFAVFHRNEIQMQNRTTQNDGTQPHTSTLQHVSLQTICLTKTMYKEADMHCLYLNKAISDCGAMRRARTVTKQHEMTSSPIWLVG